MQGPDRSRTELRVWRPWLLWACAHSGTHRVCGITPGLPADSGCPKRACTQLLLRNHQFS